MNHLLIVCFAFLSTALFGQTSQIEMVASDYERSRDLSLAYIDAMPADRFSDKPTPEIRSFSEQMLHASQGIFNLVSNASGASRPYAQTNLEKQENLQSKEMVRKIVMESFDFALEEIQKMDPLTLDEVIKKGPFSVTRMGWLQKANEHVGHHRGQCVIYLRLADVTPPSYQLF